MRTQEIYQIKSYSAFTYYSEGNQISYNALQIR